MKSRLDVLLEKKALVRSRSQAKSLIKEGRVSVEGKVIRRPGQQVDENSEVFIEGNTQVVSRGLYKLEKALDHFAISVEGLTCADVGASTGGFTQLLLDRGVKKVYAIDVGRDQLDSILEKDPRVINMEGTHINEAVLPEKVELCVVDLSFISLLKVIDSIAGLLSSNAKLVCLIKPQFEGQSKDLNDKGIVKTQERREAIIKNLLHELSDRGFKVAPLIESPITGKKGNTEYLTVITREKSLNEN